MYIPKLYREEDRARILEFLHGNGFVTLVAVAQGKPTASHLLVEVIDKENDLFINGHMSRANPLWRTFALNEEVLVIFQGPHSYISPTWYNHVNVPTWNYQAVHVHGVPRVIEEREEAYLLLKSLIERHESEAHYRLETLPPDFVEKEMRGIAVFQIKATKIEANFKLSQNRDEEDYRNIIANLEKREDELSHAVGEAMRRQRPSTSG